MVAGLGAAVSRLDIDTDGLLRLPPIEYVRVEGSLWYLDPAEFGAALEPRMADGFLRADLEGIETVARGFAWVRDAEAARVWPDTVVIRIEEQQAVARWGGDSLLNGRGERFTPKSVEGFEALPLLDGPGGQEKMVLEVQRVLDEKLRVRQQGIAALTLSKRFAWVARTTGGTEIVFGNQDPLTATDRLLALLPQLGEERIMRIQKVDLRYSNGFAVVWKPEAPLPSSTDPDLKKRSRNG